MPDAQPCTATPCPLLRPPNADRAVAVESGPFLRDARDVGAVVVGVLRNGLTLMGVASVYQVLITGILVILAVAIDQLSRKGGR